MLHTAPKTNRCDLGKFALSSRIMPCIFCSCPSSGWPDEKMFSFMAMLNSNPHATFCSGPNIEPVSRDRFRIVSNFSRSSSMEANLLADGASSTSFCFCLTSSLLRSEPVSGIASPSLFDTAALSAFHRRKLSINLPMNDFKCSSFRSLNSSLGFQIRVDGPSSGS
uniref:(northern house mosquito) hypothetical protein n=1 Tax=Culex pipiens TaxID=7175 RepID=A0A8D8DDR3_CULPI